MSMTDETPILLAEDNEDDIFAMRLAFRGAGMPNPLLVARNGQEALSYLNGGGSGGEGRTGPAPRLLLLDLKMPLMDGFDVLTRLQQRRRPKDLLVVVLTTSMEEADLRRAFELGADAYLVKPGTFRQLVEMVRGLRQRLKETPNAAPVLALARRLEDRF